MKSLFPVLQWNQLDEKHGVGVPGYGVRWCGKRGVWKTLGLVKNTWSKWKTRGLSENAGQPFFRQNMNIPH